MAPLDTPRNATVDARAFPRTARYLAAQRSGLSTYPECLAHTSILEPYVRSFAQIGARSGLPAPVAELFAARARDAWVSEVAFQAANLAVRDAGFETDAAFIDWTVDNTRELFDKPLVRQLMRLVSPTLVVMGSTKRWAAFHKGTELASAPVTERAGRAETTARLTFPRGLFSELFLQSLEGAFQVAVGGSRGADARAELRGHGDASAEYVVSWRA